jgi:retinol-binding protein 3
MSPAPRCLAALTLALAVGALPAVLAAQTMSQGPPPAIEARDRAAIVEDIAAALDEVYVFPQVAAAMGEHLRSRLAAGAYDSLAAAPELAEQLTTDLQSISRDLHLRVVFSPAPPPGTAGGPSAAEQAARQREQMRRDNYSFRKVELLPGNVGYLRLDGFSSAHLAGATAVAAMGLLAGSDALVFDLRANGGGSPSMIQLLTSYLLPGGPTHLNSFYVRQSDQTEQFWTLAWVPGSRMPEVPVYVLTSARTFSAAEEFTYNLKNLGRATIVGETTGGGAHPVQMHRVAGYPLVVSLPFGRAINPITGTNWEGTGVEPDIEVPADQALEVAHLHALGAIQERAGDSDLAVRIGFLRESLAARQNPATLAEAELRAYVGSYGPREIRLEEGRLEYRRDQGPWQGLTPMGSDRFLVGDLHSFHIRFERDAEGRVARLVGLYDDGREEPHPRAHAGAGELER